jgi:hypothetical protein
MSSNSMLLHGSRIHLTICESLMKFIKILAKWHNLVTLGFIPGVHKALKNLIYWITGINPVMTQRMVIARLLCIKTNLIKPLNGKYRHATTPNKSGNDKSEYI